MIMWYEFINHTTTHNLLGRQKKEAYWALCNCILSISILSVGYTGDRSSGP